MFKPGKSKESLSASECFDKLLTERFFSFSDVTKSSAHFDMEASQTTDALQPEAYSGETAFEHTSEY